MKEIINIESTKYKLTCHCGCTFSFDESDIEKEGVCDISYKISCPRCGSIFRSYYKNDLLKYKL